MIGLSRRASGSLRALNLLVNCLKGPLVQPLLNLTAIHARPPNCSCLQFDRDPAVPSPAIMDLAKAKRFTRREQQVAWLIRNCQKNEAIARLLNISTETVRMHIRNIHKKTSTSDKSEIVDLCWRYCIAHITSEFQKKVENLPE